jgi:hypothetical protein
VDVTCLLPRRPAKRSTCFQHERMPRVARHLEPTTTTVRHPLKIQIMLIHESTREMLFIGFSLLLCVESSYAHRASGWAASLLRKSARSLGIGSATGSNDLEKRAENKTVWISAHTYQGESFFEYVFIRTAYLWLIAYSVPTATGFSTMVPIIHSA